MNTSFASIATPFASPLYVMLKPVGARCNLRCRYCYYLDKRGLHESGNYEMSEDLLEEFTQQYFAAQTMPETLFLWHGGEPLLRGITFYKRALELQKKYACGRQVSNALQTNGTLLTDEWCQFFKRNNFLIGISLDGTQRQHDFYRKDAGDRPSFDRVMRGIQLLKKHHVDFNIMGVVNNYNADYPLEFYNFFRRNNFQYIQFTPIVERIEGELAPYNVSAEQWGKFLITIFDEWVRQDVGRFFIQYFDSTLANWMGLQPGVCSLAQTCGHSGVMEYNGDVYSCDHLVTPENRLGNIRKNTLLEMMYSYKQVKFGNLKSDSLPQQCLSCEFLFACNGECPKNRIINAADGESGLNYLCKGYFAFFRHVAPYMDFMKNEILNQRSPANVMKILNNNPGKSDNFY